MTDIPDLPMVDHTWGVERRKDSPLYGRLLLGGRGMPPILLWREPACKTMAENLTGALTHNFPVTVEKTTIVDGVRWYYISSAVVHEGKKYPQTGWVLPSMLKRLGEQHTAGR